MDISVSNQSVIFLQSCLLGGIIGVLYDIFRILRLAFKTNKYIILVQDLIFFIIAAIITFVFLLINGDGQIRIFIIIGEILGFTIYFLTLGVVVIKSSKFIINIIKSILMFIYKLLIRPFVKIFCFIFSKFRFIFEKITIKSKKILKNQKFYLKKKRSMLYNLINSTSNHEKEQPNAKKKFKKKKEKKECNI